MRGRAAGELQGERQAGPPDERALAVAAGRMQAGKALQVARLRGAELGEMARELVEDLSARFLQELANTTDIDADRKKDKGETAPGTTRSG